MLEEIDDNSENFIHKHRNHENITFMVDFITKTLSRNDDSKVFCLICIDDVVLKFQTMPV